MTLIPYDNLTLSRVIDKRRPAQTPVLDAHFGGTGGTDQVAAEAVQIDVIDGPEGLMVAIGRDTESRKVPGDTVSTQTITIPRFSEHDLLSSSDVAKYRAPGQVGAPEAFDRMLMRKLDKLRARIDRTKEYMAIKALQGSVVDGGGNVIATYPVPSAVSVDFDGAANGVDAFDEAVIAITRALGYQPERIIAYAGKTAYAAIRNNTKIAALLNSTAGVDLITTGNLPNVAGVEVRRLVGVYADASGTDQPFLGDTAVIVTAADADFQLIHGPCSAAQGRLALMSYYVQQSDVDDPPSTKIRVESNPLVVVNRPEAVYRMTAT